jgi:Nucleotidyl transferase AbiEii toxin, Type IV TA system
MEINTREIESYDPPLSIPFRVENPWFSGAAEIATFSREEILATKLRALLQRSKGRDLFDLDYSLQTFEGLNPARIVECFGRYLERSGIAISRAEAEQRMFAKLANPTFLTDMRPLLPADRAAQLTDDAAKAAFTKVFSQLVALIPGEPWVRTPEMRERFGIED